MFQSTEKTEHGIRFLDGLVDVGGGERVIVDVEAKDFNRVFFL